ncbi:hypothetical protein HAX54_016612 [Datura stramonium]|uniref:Uncharacterized protein n=1 Tax=Datura stramonium TaxID=4076 RepID=A0ABS8UKU0_DATST|nr:hypothetical protein [Datura stramonium]
MLEGSCRKLSVSKEPSFRLSSDHTQEKKEVLDHMLDPMYTGDVSTIHLVDVVVHMYCFDFFRKMETPRGFSDAIVSMHDLTSKNPSSTGKEKERKISRSSEFVAESSQVDCFGVGKFFFTSLA